MNYSFVNGEIIDSEKASISIFDRGVILGDGLFETVKAVEGVPEFFDEHWSRLYRSAEKLYLNIPYSIDEVQGIIKSLSDKNSLNESIIRLTITRGISPGLSIDPAVKPTVIITCLPVPPKDEALYEKGVHVAITSVKRSSASGIDGHIKTTNYLANIMAKAEADKKGGYEGIFLGDDGDIAEMTTASFFCVINGVLRTPPLDADILPGITRMKILEAAKILQLQYSEEPVYPSDLLYATEAFLTSSVRGVMPISSVEEYHFSENRPVYEKLSKEYERMAKESVSQGKNQIKV